MRLHSFVFWSCVAFACTGCDTDKVAIQQRQFPQRNPTLYEFDAPLDAVRRALNEARGENWQNTQQPFEGAVLAWKGNGDPFAKDALTKPGNQSDAYLHGMGYAVGKSRVYLKDGQELPYYADFHIHITAISASRTRVEVLTEDSRVEAGTEWHPFARAGVFVVVPPTSIEEYQILLDMGKALGVRGMTNLMAPDRNAPTRTIRATRRP